MAKKKKRLWLLKMHSGYIISTNKVLAKGYELWCCRQTFEYATGIKLSRVGQSVEVRIVKARKRK